MTVIAKTRIDGRPRPPGDLTPEQKRIWDKVVATEPADLFATESTQHLLKNCCRHLTSSDHFTKLVDGHIAYAQLPVEERPDVLPISLSDLKLLLQMRERETDGNQVRGQDAADQSKPLRR